MILDLPRAVPGRGQRVLLTLRADQTVKSRAALSRTTTAVAAKWMPNAAALVPPMRSTIEGTRV